MGLLRRERIEDGAVQHHALPVERDRPSREESQQRFNVGLEESPTVAAASVRKAERLVLELEPAGAETEIEPSTGSVIEGGRHLREESHIAERHAVDEVSEPHTLRDPGEVRQRRPGLEDRPVRRTHDTLKMVDQPDGVEPGILRQTGVADDVVPAVRELRQNETELHVTPQIVGGGRA